MTVICENTSGLKIPFQGQLAKLADKVISAELNGNINLVFCGKQYIQNLNFSFRKKNRPTDVLSFIYSEPEILGEIYISPEIAKCQAPTWDNTFYRELKRLVVHGCLHLAGWLHDSPGRKKKFCSKEEFYLRK